MGAQENFVVIGRSSSFGSEVNHDYCQRHGIPVFRRVTGGAAIVTGPGCLMYGVLLDYRRRPELRMLDQAHQFVMQKMAAAVRGLGIETEIEGICDLTINHRKVSGQQLTLQAKLDAVSRDDDLRFRSLADRQSVSIGPSGFPTIAKNVPTTISSAAFPTTTQSLSEQIQQQWETEGNFEDFSMRKSRNLLVRNTCIEGMEREGALVEINLI